MTQPKQEAGRVVAEKVHYTSHVIRGVASKFPLSSHCSKRALEPLAEESWSKRNSIVRVGIDRSGFILRM